MKRETVGGAKERGTKIEGGKSKVERYRDSKESSGIEKR